MDKNKLRIELLNKRKNDPGKDKLIFNKLINLPQFKASNIILSYVSKKDEQSKNIEIDTMEFIKYCFINKHIFVPKTYEHEIVFYEICSFNDLESGKFGVLEPKKYCEPIERELLSRSFCLTPALACNEENHRIGYGKGYYDKFLKEYKGFSAASCYKNNILNFKAGKNDIPVDIVITD